MDQNTDLSYWQIIGGAIAGILTGAGAVFGVNKKLVDPSKHESKSEIRVVQDAIIAMKKDIRHMNEAHKAHVATLERLEKEHDVVIAELFSELKQIGLALREVAVEVRYAINQKGEQR